MGIIPGTTAATEPLYVAVITPVIHHCMGGVKCSVDAECIETTGKVLLGLYVTGEAAGGIHGNNRVGSNSLLARLRDHRPRGGQGGMQVHLWLRRQVQALPRAG